MCYYCEPKGWNRKTCDICGVGSKTYISISIEVPNESDYPYSTTSLCKDCFIKYGFNIAIEHNQYCVENSS